MFTKNNKKDLQWYYHAWQMKKIQPNGHIQEKDNSKN
jgi:hypothetical protein